MSRQKYYTCDGYTLTLNEWSKKTGLDTSVIRMRLHNGWDIKRAVYTPNLKRQYVLDGSLYTLGELAERSNNLSKFIIGYRIRNGMNVHDAITLPRIKKKRTTSPCGMDCFECPYGDCIKK